MHPRDEKKTTFITKIKKYYYRVMPFDMKNVGATYQYLMDEVFQDQIGKNMEVCVDDMVVKSEEVEYHA